MNINRHKVLVGGNVILVRGRLGYVSYAKNALGLEFWAILSLTPPPPVSALGCNHNVPGVYRYFQEQMLGCPRSSRGCTIWNARGRLGGGENLPKLVFWLVFWQPMGKRRITAGDCGAIVELTRACPGSPTDTSRGLRRWGPHP